jgi:opacity protein-like surface antigen
MKHQWLAFVLGAGLAVGLGGAVPAAAAAPPETSTTTQKNLVETFVDVVPTCEGGGALYTITTTSNLIEHETVFDDGRVHATFTQTGTFVATNPTLPDFTGKFTTWGNFNANGSTTNTTFTFTVRGVGDDGSTFQHHETAHSNTRPDGSVQEFFRCHDS